MTTMWPVYYVFDVLYRDGRFRSFIVAAWNQRKAHELVQEHVTEHTLRVHLAHQTRSYPHAERFVREAVTST